MKILKDLHTSKTVGLAVSMLPQEMGKKFKFDLDLTGDLFGLGML